MLVRRNSNIDTDELERAVGALKLKLKQEENIVDAAHYKGGIAAWEALLYGRPKTFEDVVVIFEAACFRMEPYE